MADQKYKVFVSSVQKELEPERLALFGLITTDPFLKDYFEPVLFENMPPPIRPTSQPYLEVLDQCDIYILLLDREYGSLERDCSATHHEYNLACKKELPSLAMIKGRYDSSRERRVQEFIGQIKRDKFTYKRFIDRIDLKKEVSAWLIRLLKDELNIMPPPEVAESGQETIEAASIFETIQQEEVSLEDLDIDESRILFSRLKRQDASSISMDEMAKVFRVRGLVWVDAESGAVRPTAGGVVFLGRDPALRFPQCQVLADAYRDTKVTSKPFAQKVFSGPVPQLIENLLSFVEAHTAHPTRIVGINRVTLDEYPQKAVREALVNAFAHHDYEDSSRKVRLEIFTDRLVISSPGYPPKPLTLAKLRKGNYESCRRNPVIAECLASIDLMEQRGTGFERMKAAMLDHGLEGEKMDQRDGYFKLILPGPNGDYDRLRAPSDAKGLVPPSVEEQLNERQKRIMVQVQQEGVVTSGWCKDKLGVTYNTAFRDLSDLVKRGLLVQIGKGRATHYVIYTGEDR